MKLFVCLVSSNQILCSEFARRQNGIFPKESLPSALKEGVTINTGVFNSETNEDLLNFLSLRTKKMDGVIILIDNSALDLIKEIKYSFFPVLLEVPRDYLNKPRFPGNWS